MEEATEYLIKLYLERKGYLVSTSKIYYYTQEIKIKNGKTQPQKTPIQLDIVAINPITNDRIIGEVKSWFGSTGVNKNSFKSIYGSKWNPKQDRFKLINSEEVQKSAFEEVEKEFGRGNNGFRLALFIGHYYKPNESEVKDYLSKLKINGNSIFLPPFEEIVDFLLKEILEPSKEKRKITSYENDIAIQTLKILHHFNKIKI
jgi:hypothetical protein